MASLTRHLCWMHLQCAVPLQRMVICIVDEVAGLVRAIRTVVTEANENAGTGLVIGGAVLAALSPRQPVPRSPWMRFSEAVVISSIGIVMHERMRQGGSRHIGRVWVYFNDVSVQDVTTLKAQSHMLGWQPLCQLYFGPAREGLLGSPKPASAELSAKLSMPLLQLVVQVFGVVMRSL